MQPKQLILVLLGFFPLLLSAQFGSPNDCVAANLVCTSDDIAFNPDGGGMDDFEGPDNGGGCITAGEQNSAWFYFEIDDDAPPDQELGFILTPFGGNAEDYDFALWGPDVACDSLGDPIRCSYADDGCDFCPQTGMGMGETDESENPFGNGFVSTLIVQPGQGFYLMVDNFNGTSNGFNLEWTGEAGDDLACNAPPCSVEIELGDAITQCAGEGAIDLTVLIIGNGDPYDISWTGTNGGTAFLDDPSAISPTATIPDDFDGEIVYSVVVISVDGECIEEGTITVTINPTPDPMIEGIEDLCPADDPLQLTGTPANGVWGGAANGSGMVDPEGLAAGPIEVTYTFTDGIGCSNSVTELITILPAPEIMITEIDPLCSTGDPITLVATPTGGTWSAPVNGEELDPADLALGENTLTYTFTNVEGCTSDEEFIVEVIEPIVSQITGPMFLCTNSPAEIYEGFNPGGEWGGVADFSGTVVPEGLIADMYEVTYMSPPMNCNIPAILDLTVNNPPEALIEERVIVCNTGVTMVDFDDQIIAGDDTGTWLDVDDSGATGVFPILDFIGVTPGVYTFRYRTNTALEGCEEASYDLLVVVEECNCPSLSMIDPDSLCQDDLLILLDDLKITTEDGIWSLESMPSGPNPADFDGVTLSGTGVDTGLYVLRFTLLNPQVDCPDSVEIDVYVSAIAELILLENLDVCNSEESGSLSNVINLNDAIVTTDSLGVWRDIDGSGAVGDIDSLDFTSVTPGVYRFVYESSNAVNPCSQLTDTLEVNVLNCECPEILIDNIDTLCNVDFLLNLNDFVLSDGAGTWQLDIVPSGSNPALLTDSVFTGMNSDAGSYDLQFILDESPPTGCPTGITVMIEVIASPLLELSDTVDVCNTNASTQFPTEIDLFSTITSGSTSGTWEDLDASGATGPFANLSFIDVTQGTYRFVFATTDATDPCINVTDTLVMRVNDCNCPSVALSTITIRCNDNAEFSLDLVNNSGSTGTWTIVSAPTGGNPAVISGIDFQGNGADPGSYILQFTLDQSVPPGCPDTNRT